MTRATNRILAAVLAGGLMVATAGTFGIMAIAQEPKPTGKFAAGFGPPTAPAPLNPLPRVPELEKGKKEIVKRPDLPEVKEGDAVRRGLQR